MLEGHYARYGGLVAFLDESYRADPRDGEFPFYTVSATLVHSDALEETRRAYLDLGIGGWWHTAELYERGERWRIRDFIGLVAKQKTPILVAAQLHMLNNAPEQARRECLLQLCAHLADRDCRLVVYERRHAINERNSDASLFQKAKAFGLLPRTVNTFSGHPGAENLLWGPDLAGWAMRRHLALADSVWVKPLAPHVEVIDVSEASWVKKKKPESAAANDSGSESSAGLKDEGRYRSPGPSIAHHGRSEQAIFTSFHVTSKPLHDPVDLSLWLSVSFPGTTT